MPVVQISKIKLRKGLLTDLPQLDEGELGLAVDSGQLYIGTSLPILDDILIPSWMPDNYYYRDDYVAVYSGPSKTIYRSKLDHTSSSTFDVTNWSAANPGTIYNNTQILTQWSRNVENIISYSYINRNTIIDSSKTTGQPYSVEKIYSMLKNIWPVHHFKRTNSTAAETIGITRILQERLDERVSVLSFGATGTGKRNKIAVPSTRNTNDMESEANAFREAVVTLANYDTTSILENNKTLHVPGGTYTVNKFIFAASGVNICGDGIGKTKIVFNVNGVTFDKNNNFLFTTIGRRTNGIELETPTVEKVINQTDLSNFMYNNIAENARNIIISNITFEIFGNNTSPVDILRLIRCNNITFINCEFLGNWNTSNYHIGTFNMNTDSQAVLIDSCSGVSNTSVSTCEDIKFINCLFKQVFCVSNINDYTNKVVFDNCKIASVYQGIVCSQGVLNAPTWVSIPNLNSLKNGPKNISITNSRFKNVNSTAVAIYRGYASDGSGGRSTSYSLYEQNEKLTSSSSYDQVSGIFVGFNSFDNVGNYPSQTLILIPNHTESAFVPVIYFGSGTQYNMSIGNIFSRDVSVSITNDTKSRTFYDKLDPNAIMNTQDDFYFPGMPTAGNGLVFVGNALNVDVSNNTIAIGTGVIDNKVIVNNSSILGETLLSTGVVGEEAEWGSLDLSNPNARTGVLPSPNGGTGIDTYAQGDLLIGTNSNSLAPLTIGTDGYLLQSAGGNPTWAVPPPVSKSINTLYINLNAPANVANIGTVLANSRIIRITVNVKTIFNNTATLTVGSPASPAMLLDTSDTNLFSLDFFIKDTDVLVTSDTVLNYTLSGTNTSGQASIFIEYVNP